jgi:AcrR family transcriptional regulator
LLLGIGTLYRHFPTREALFEAVYQLFGQVGELLHFAAITPAARATASRLASAPPALKTALAASRTRSRLRTASARGLRVLFSNCLMPTTNLERS